MSVKSLESFPSIRNGKEEDIEANREKEPLLGEKKSSYSFDKIYKYTCRITAIAGTIVGESIYFGSGLQYVNTSPVNYTNVAWFATGATMILAAGIIISESTARAANEKN